MVDSKMSRQDRLVMHIDRCQKKLSKDLEVVEAEIEGLFPQIFNTLGRTAIGII